MKVPERANESEIILSKGMTIETLNNINFLRIWEGRPYDAGSMINVDSPEEVDELIEALQYGRMLMTHGPHSQRPSAFDGKPGPGIEFRR